jgi:putative phosphoesterase
MDFGKWAGNLGEAEKIRIGEAILYVCHIRNKSNVAQALEDADAIIYGHTHRPSVEKHYGILFLNPGSAGQRRHGNPLSVAMLYIRGKDLRAEIVELGE